MNRRRGEEKMGRRGEGEKGRRGEKVRGRTKVRVIREMCNRTFYDNKL